MPSSLHYQELLRLSLLSCVDEGRLEESMAVLTKSIAETLNVSRVSIWLYNEDRTSIVCSDLYESAKDLHSSGTVLRAADFPAYFNFLLEERTLPASDAHTHCATSEFSEPYLKPLGIESLLDAPIRVAGKMIGVICCEQVGKRRDWNFHEQMFLGNMTDILARAFQAFDRTQAQLRLTEINSTLEELVEARTEQVTKLLAQSANSAKLSAIGEMAAGIAHEINTPLNTILFLAESSVSLVTPSDGSDELVAQLASIEKTALRISKIVQGLKWFARESDSRDHKLIDMSDVVDQSLSLCQQRLSNNGIEVIWERPANPIQVMCADIQIGQVLVNLLNNAFDAVQLGPDRWIQIRVQGVDENVEIQVSNGGTTIATEVRAKMFQPFFTTKPIGAGTGLGLSISRGIVEQHNGTLYLDESSEYTCFVVRLKREPVKAELVA